MQNSNFKDGMFVGVFIGLVIFTIIFWIALKLDLKQNPEHRYTPNAILNNREWKIDTTKHITNKDTTITYKFVKIE